MAGERPSKRARRNCDDRMKVPSCGAVGGGVYKRVFYCIVCIWLFIPLYIKRTFRTRLSREAPTLRHTHMHTHIKGASADADGDAY